MTLLTIAGATLPPEAVAQRLPPPESYTECTQATNAFLTVYGAGMAAEALAYGKHAVDICRSQKGERDPDTMTSISNLAVNMHALGRYAEALALHEEALRLRRTHLGAAHPSTFSSMNNVATSYSDLGRFAEALALHEEALKLRRASLGSDDPATLITMSNLATSYSDLGRHEEARALNEETLQRRRRVLGAEHADTLLSMNLLAGSLSALGRYAEALALGEQTLALRRARHGMDHPETFSSMNNLAIVYSDMGRYGEALALLEQTLALRRTQLGPAHPDTFKSMINLATVYREVGRFSDALALQEEGVGFLRTVLGENHPYTLTGMNNQAATYNLMGRRSEALAIYEEVLRRRRTVLGADHPETLTAMNNLATSYGRALRHDEALALFNEVYKLRRAKLGANHPDTLITLSNLAVAHDNLGHREEAIRLHEQALKSRRAQLGEVHPATLESMDALADDYFSAGQLSNVVPLVRGYIAGAERLRVQKGLTGDDQQNLFAGYANRYRQFSRFFGAIALQDAQQSNALLKEGFTIADRSKARTLIENMGRRTAGRAAGLPEAEQQVLERLSGEAAAMEQALAKQQELPKPDPQTVQRLQARKRALADEYLAVQERLKSAYPKYAQLLDVKLAQPEDARRLLSADQILLSYTFEANGRLAAWLLDNSGEPRFVDLGLQNTLADKLTQLRDQLMESGDRKASSDLLGSLSDILLKPLLDAGLEGKRRWIIVPDGDLALLPFDVLPLPGDGIAILRHEISIVQSWSVYALLKQREAEYSRLTRGKTLFAMGNAVYSVAETQAPAASPAEARGLRNAAFPEILAGGLREQAERYAMQNLEWSNLPGTATEIDAVSRVFGAGVDTFTGAQASEARMQELNRKGTLNDYRYLLFSAHGYLATNPALTSLVLSQNQRTLEADGYITAAEWPGYDIKSDLTVFSACDTGVGKTLPGEGVMGLPYALFVAGNKNTLLTLWPVDDAATAEFMSHFFNRLADGASQIAALTATKREFVSHPRWSAPQFWAAFILYGV